ncbi:FAD-dependent oxidoreductase [Proteus mirabilis]|uniref:FAD-dependent oxidoreductase n=1 Tax=Proteus mirabilis TaxID=584 RepID=A0A2X2BMQ9_PROMI|nr:FAD-dependent oxidoreductase [Proteus mirabilis]
MMAILRQLILKIICIVLGASFRRDRLDLNVSIEEQQNNQWHLTHCLAQSPWAQQVDFSDNDARVGIRCTIRDHLPLLGEVPDFEKLVVAYTHLDRFKRRKQTPIWHRVIISFILLVH